MSATRELPQIHDLAPEEAARLEASFQKSSPEERARLLDKSPPRQVPPSRRFLMLLGLRDTDPRVRRAAARWTSWTDGAPDMREEILRSFQTDPDEETRAGLAFGLCNSAAEPGVAAALVESFRKDPDKIVDKIFSHFDAWSGDCPYGRTRPEVYRAAAARPQLSREQQKKLANGLRKATHMVSEAEKILRTLLESADIEVYETATEALKSLQKEAGQSSPGRSARQGGAHTVSLEATIERWEERVDIKLRVVNQSPHPILLPFRIYLYDTSEGKGTIRTRDDRCYVLLQPGYDPSALPLTLALRFPYLGRVHLLDTREATRLDPGFEIEHSLYLPLPLEEQSEYVYKTDARMQVLSLEGVALTVHYLPLEQGTPLFLPGHKFMTAQQPLTENFPEISLPVLLPILPGG